MNRRAKLKESQEMSVSYTSVLCIFLRACLLMITFVSFRSMQYHEICLWKQRTDVWYCTKKEIDERKRDTVVAEELMNDIHSNESILKKFLKEMKNVWDDAVVMIVVENPSSSVM